MEKKSGKRTFLISPKVNKLCEFFGVNTPLPHINLISTLTLTSIAMRQQSVSILYDFYYNLTKGCIGNINTLRLA